MKLLAAVVIVACGLVSPIHAHEGHTHNVLGTLTSVTKMQLEVKATDGKTLTVVFDAKTPITRGKDRLDATALKAGERVSVDYTEDKGTNTAKTIKLGTAPAAGK